MARAEDGDRRLVRSVVDDLGQNVGVPAGRDPGEDVAAREAAAVPHAGSRQERLRAGQHLRAAEEDAAHRPGRGPSPSANTRRSHAPTSEDSCSRRSDRVPAAHILRHLSVSGGHSRRCRIAGARASSSRIGGSTGGLYDGAWALAPGGAYSSVGSGVLPRAGAFAVGRIGVTHDGAASSTEWMTGCVSPCVCMTDSTTDTTRCGYVGAT
jgi:hypothetical protein